MGIESGHSPSAYALLLLGSLLARGSQPAPQRSSDQRQQPGRRCVLSRR
ncbi:hypothetical protein ADILRU_2433 [Leifsonia rubra CMS 76R]|nr:hypothetical protein ADILRU_2433 [Leifsonia rubra CMS 76R]